MKKAEKSVDNIKGAEMTRLGPDLLDYASEHLGNKAFEDVTR